MKKLIGIATIAFCHIFCSLAQAKSKTENVCFSIPKMHCQGCVDRISEEIESVKGVEKVSIDLTKKVASVSVTDGFSEFKSIVNASENAGYPAKKVKCEVAAEGQKAKSKKG